MLEIRQTPEFAVWLRALRDDRAVAKIAARIRYLAQGNPGDVKPVGEGLSELRIHYGGGYRVYFKKMGKQIVVLLCGGDKASQSKDIARAKALARDLKE
jgi:putative addiction module killer protein